ncbi:GET complex subunit get1, partial [Coemansia sp. RSA 2599]
HSRFHSHGGARLIPPMPPLPTAEKPESSPEGTPGGSLSRQRSMPHLRSASRDGSGSAPELPTEAYFDTASGALAVIPTIASRAGAYFSPVPTRASHHRRLAKRSLCLLWLTSAAAFVVLKRHEDAANAVSEALAACPDSPEALTMRGQLELSQDHCLPALNDFHAAVSLEPTNIRASVSLARVEYLLARRDVALGLLKNITRAHGWSDPEAWYWLGRLERELAQEQSGPSNARMVKRALEYTTYALDLETSQPVRPFSILRFDKPIASIALDAVGYSVVSAMLWDTYSRITNSKKAHERLHLREAITQMRSELRTISSVDQFAKWAKLRRKLDAASASFERVSGELAIERTAFELYVNLVLRVLIYGSRAILNIYNYRVAVFYVPANWYYPVLWFLSLPSAPTGSVSVTVWSFACNRVCKRAAAIFNRVMKPIEMPNRQQQQQQQQQIGVMQPLRGL